jgi:hypothetical protein
MFPRLLCGYLACGVEGIEVWRDALVDGIDDTYHDSIRHKRRILDCKDGVSKLLKRARVSLSESSFFFALNLGKAGA